MSDYDQCNCFSLPILRRPTAPDISGVARTVTTALVPSPVSMGKAAGALTVTVGEMDKSNNEL